MAYRKTNVKPNDLIHTPGGLNPGSQIVIRGRVLEHETQFVINLKCGEEDDADIALHFNPRNNDGDSVVRNSFQGGAWHGEERDIPRFPFDNGRKFTIRIMTTPDHYRILVNNYDFVRFDHRIPSSEVRYVQLGDGAEYYETLVQNNCHVPFSGQFPGGLKIGQSVRVRGMVKDDAERFVINFQCDSDGDTIGMHFNPRQDEEDVVLNAKLGGDWGDEQRGFENDFAFKRGEFFDAFFVATEGRFNVYVNEKYFTCFDYRCDHCEICHLTVNGDVDLMDVELLDPLPDDFIKEIPQGLEKNDLIVTKGFFYPEGNKFAVNLIKGCSCDDDIALHFNPRRDEGEIVFNSKEGGDWEDEERHPLPSAMQEMVPFELEILTKKNKFKVFANDRKVCKFRARDDIEDIKAINVAGDAYIYEVKLLRKLEEPFTDSVPGTLEPGNWIVIQGAPDDDADGFAINLQCGEDAESDDIAMHFNVRFSEGQVVLNSREGGEWGREERDAPYFPFEPEDRFELALCVMQHGIRVFVNHRRYTDFNFRINPDRICHLFLSGGCDYFEPEFY
uniref:Galectin-3 n=1 Tax=Littorina littorea TaxID=31216 RepID=A0A0A7RPY6_LITLI|nr:galectin-3 [Littorina littorea]